MLGWLAGLKPKLWALLGAVLAFLALILRNRHLEYQRDKARHRAKSAEAQIQFETDVDEADSEISAEYSDLRERAREDRKNGQVPDHLRDSNSW